MNTWQHPIRILTVIAALCGLAHGQTTSRLSTAFLARGEQALLEISVAGGEPTEMPEIPAVPKATIQPSPRGPQTRIMPGRRLEYVFEYVLSSYEIGRHVIPPVTVMVDGRKTLTEPLAFEIFNPDELEWSEVQAGGRTIRYASSFRTLNLTPFENETTPTEIKLFVPEELIVEDWGIPDFERDGVTAWRFQPSPPPQPDQFVRSALSISGLSEHHHPDAHGPDRNRSGQDPADHPGNDHGSLPQDGEPRDLRRCAQARTRIQAPARRRARGL